MLDKSVSDNQAPFMVGMTVNAAGVTFTGGAGEAAAGRKAGADTVFRIFSMSKAIGTTAAMILIDRGQLSMDTPVESVLPDFAGVRVLAGYDAAGKAIFKAPRVKSHGSASRHPHLRASSTSSGARRRPTTCSAPAALTCWAPRTC